MPNCRLCHVDFEHPRRANRLLYCPDCRETKRAQWRAASRKRRARAHLLGQCAVCDAEIAGSRARRLHFAPGKLFCPRCSMVLNSRLTRDEYARLLAFRFESETDFSLLEERNSNFSVDTPSDSPYS